jgi:gliding motility-associated-like protein
MIHSSTRFRQIFLIFLLLALPWCLQAQSYSWLWAKKEGSIAAEAGRKVAVDVDGNVFVTGLFGSTFTVGSNTYVNQSMDVVLIKYDATGKLIWSIPISSQQDDDVTSVIPDLSGGVYIAGTFKGASLSYPGGSLINSSSGSEEVFLLRVSGNGAVQWSFSPKGTGTDYSGKLCTDGNSVVMSGYFQSPHIDFDSYGFNNTSYKPIFLCRLDNTGKVIWAKTIGKDYIDKGDGLAMDKAGNIYMGGTMASSSLNIDGNSMTLTGSGTNGDLFVSKFDANGTCIWARNAQGTGVEELTGLGMDASENLYFTGSFTSPTLVFKTYSITNTSGKEEYLIGSIDANGLPRWLAKANSETVSRGTDIAVQGNDIYTTGYFSGSPLQLGSSLVNNGSNDLFLAQYDGSGKLIWSNASGGSGDDRSYGVAVTSCGGVVAGEFNSSSIYFGGIKVTNSNSGTTDILSARFARQLNYPAFPDTTRSCDPALTLDAGSGYSNYIWMTGQTSQAIDPEGSGLYSVKVVDKAGCIGEDSTYVSVVQANILQKDTSICRGSSLKLAIDSSYLQGRISLTFSKAMNANWSVGVNTIPHAHYRLVVKGTWKPDALAGNALDAAYQYAESTNTMVRKWQAPADFPLPFKVNNLSIRPINDAFRSDHTYEYQLTSTSTQFSFDFTDAYVMDNSGSLDFELYRVNDPVRIKWSTGDTTNTISVKPLVTTTYTVTMTDGITTCTDKVTITVDNSVPLDLPDTVRSCGSTVTLDGSKAFSTYSWSTGENTQQIQVTKSGRYSLDVKNSTGCHYQDSTIVSLVVADILQNDQVICAGSSLDLTTAQAPSGSNWIYTWNSGQTTSSITVKPVQDTIYRVRISDGISACSDSIKLKVSVVDTTLGVIGTLAFCDGGSVDLKAGKAVTYQWIHDGLSLVGSTLQTLTVHSAGMYQVKLTDDNGCVDSSRSVTVTNFTSPVVSLDAGGPVTFCEGGDVQLNSSVIAGGGAGLVYSWSKDGVLLPGVNAPSYTTSRSGIYVVTLTNAGGCTGTSRSIKVAVEPVPVVTLTPGTNASICEGQEQNIGSGISPSGFDVASYVWQKNGITDPSAKGSSVVAKESGKYVLIVTGSNGCSGRSAGMDLTVNPLPSGKLTSPSDLTLCKGDQISLQVDGGSTYRWMRNGVVDASSTSSDLSARDTGTYSVEISSAAGCRSMATGTAVITYKITPTLDFSFLPACAGSSTVFINGSTFSGGGSINYSWDLGDGASLEGDQAEHIYTQGGEYRVILTATTSVCPSSPEKFAKAVRITSSRPGINYGLTNAVSDKPVTLQARSFGNTYRWAPSQGLSDPGSDRTDATLNKDGQFTVTITDIGGCVTVDTVLVRVFPGNSIYVPSAFTPNGDGLNDRLYPVMAGYKELHFFRVYNRLGNLVFETNRMGKEFSWDGTIKGYAQQTGDYIWALQAVDENGHVVNQKGNTTLIH